MKTLILFLVAIAIVGSFGACTTVVKEPSTHTSSTTTEEVSVHRPAPAVVSETRTTRSY